MAATPLMHGTVSWFTKEKDKSNLQAPEMRVWEG